MMSGYNSKKMIRISFLVLAWYSLSTLSSVFAVKVEPVRLPLVVAFSTIFIYLVANYSKHNTGTAFKAKPKVNNHKVSGSDTEMQDLIIKDIENPPPPAQNKSKNNSINPIDVIKIALLHLFHQYSNFAIGYWIGNASYVQIWRSLEPALSFFSYGQNYNYCDNAIHFMLSSLILIIQLFQIPENWNHSTSDLIVQGAIVVMNSQILIYRNSILRKYHQDNFQFWSVIVSAFHIASVMSCVILSVIYVLFVDALVKTEWPPVYFLSMLIHSTYLFLSIFLLKHWSVVIYSSAALLKRHLISNLLTILFGVYQVPVFLAGCLGMLSGLYAIATHLAQARRHLFAGLTVISTVGISLLLYAHSREMIITQGLQNQIPLKIAILTAAGNGNIGDALQPLSWMNHIEQWNRRQYNGQRKVELFSWSAEHCCYSFDDANKRVVRSISDLEANLPHVDMVIVGGGGLLSYPHLPLSIVDEVDNSTTFWRSRIVDPFPHVAWYFLSLGADGKNGFRLSSQISLLLQHAKYVSGRDIASQLTMQSVFHGLSVQKHVDLLVDPVLVDSVKFPLPTKKVVKTSNIVTPFTTCWILRLPLEEGFAQIVDEHLNHTADLLFALEWQDNNFYNRFAPSEVTIYNIDAGWFYWNLINRCDFVVSMRYHGSIMAFRALKNSMGIDDIGRKGSRKITLLYNAMKNPDCVVHDMMDASEFRLKFHACRKKQFDQDATRHQIASLQSQFQSSIDALFKPY
jgi:hypothetical protein